MRTSNIKLTSNRGLISKFSNKLWKTSQKSSLERQKVENWMTIGCTELIEATR